MLNNSTLQLLDRKSELNRREAQVSLDLFRKESQKKETQRDFDLYDPQGKLKDKPARIADSDPRNGTSSIQKFEGEDLEQESRLNLQKQQMRSWISSQIKEKHAIDSAALRNNNDYESFFLDMQAQAREMNKSELQARRNRNIQDAEFNRKMVQ